MSGEQMNFTLIEVHEPIVRKQARQVFESLLAGKQLRKVDGVADLGSLSYVPDVVIQQEMRAVLGPYFASRGMSSQLINAVYTESLGWGMPLGNEMKNRRFVVDISE